MSNITNTSRDDIHYEWVGGRNPRAVEAQEKRGQEQLVNSTCLPTAIRGDRTLLTAAGVALGPPLLDDPLFCNAELPPGWAKLPTEHAMWSKLVDETGAERAKIFYKAAFYDRDAFLVVTEQN
jgi:hypothetical protein